MSTSKEENSKVISKENSSGFQSWELPNVNSDGGNGLHGSLLTANELENIHQQAYSEGYEEGKLRGIKDGFEQGEEEGKKQGHQRAFDASLKEIQQQTFHFEQLYKAIESPLSLSNEQVEYELMTLACSIAKIIIQSELKIRPDLVITLVKKSLNLLPSASKNIKIYLNPLDVLMVKEAFLSNEEIHFDEYKIFESINLKRGGCIIDTNLSRIDASLDKRISELAKKIISEPPNLKKVDVQNNTDTVTDIADLIDADIKKEQLEDEPLESENTQKRVDSGNDAEITTDPGSK